MSKEVHYYFQLFALSSLPDFPDFPPLRLSAFIRKICGRQCHVYSALIEH